MRRSDKKMNNSATLRILKEGEFGVLSLADDGENVYGVPMSYSYTDGKIYFHCAQEGKKLDLLQKNPKASFCVVGKTELIPERFTTAYESVIVQGRCRLVDGTEKMDALLFMVSKYAPEHMESGRKYAKNDAHKTTVICLEIAEMTGKRGKG